MSATLWPFAPEREVLDAVSWLTDVLRTRASEQRQNLRALPRRELGYSHTLDQADTALARKLMRSATSWELPDWTRLVRADVAPGTSVALADGPVIIWRSARDYDRATVASGVILGTFAAQSNAQVIPVYPARLIDKWSASRPAGQWVKSTVTFEVCETAVAESEGYYPQYLGHDIVTDCSIVGSASLSESIGWQSDLIDNQVAAPVELRTLDYADAAFAVRWWGRNVTALRQWIYSRRGKWRSFWLPSWSRDMLKLSGSGSALTVDDYDPAEPHLAALIGGTLYPRQVLSATESGGAWSLTLNAELPSGYVSRLMYLRHVRFDADRIEFQYQSAAGVAVSVPCVEVPE